MKYTPLTILAMRLAYDAHREQTDETGLPYILHPLHLAEEMQDEISTCVALLHDVAEDTDLTLEAMAEQFPPEVMGPLGLLKHEAGTDYFAYIRRLREDPVARQVKLADLAHNSDESRYGGCPPPPEKLAWRREKYARALAILEGREQ